MKPTYSTSKSCPQVMRRSSLLPLLLAISLGAANMAPGQTTIDTIAVDDVQRGDKGYGLSVFSGTAPERFDVEVLGLMRNLHPGTSFILARLHGKGLEDSGVIAGMSGSPIYLGDQLAGAVAFSWTFSKEAIAGITPIGAMREMGSLPRVPAIPPPSSVELEQLMSGEFSTLVLQERIAQLAPRLVNGANSSLQWGTVGFGESTRSLLEKALGPVAPAGSSPDLDTELAAGSAVAGLLVGGDLQMTFTGTVTERRGDEILAFGHSYMGLGPIRVPMATAEVVSVISSRSSSFKLANVGPVVGAFEEDRLVGMLGRMGSRAHTIPLSIRVLGTPERSYEVEVADIPINTPTLSAVSVLEAMDVARHQAGNQDLLLRARLKLAGYEELDVEQHFTGNNAPLNSAIYVLSLMSFVMNNNTESVTVEGLDIELTQSPEPQTVTLVGAHASRSEVHPGESLTVHLDLRRFRGETFRKDLEVTVPGDLAKGPYYLFVGDGASIDAARLRMEPTVPRDFSESFDVLQSQHGPRDLVVLGVVRGKGLVVNGRTLPQLPASIRSMWAASGPLVAKGVNLAVRNETVEVLDDPLEGAVRIDLKILPPRS